MQLLNKMDGKPFNQNDENLFEVNIVDTSLLDAYNFSGYFIYNEFKIETI